jgi:hypothetical protein
MDDIDLRTLGAGDIAPLLKASHLIWEKKRDFGQNKKKFYHCLKIRINRKTSYR